MSKALPWAFKAQSFTGPDAYGYSYSRHSYSRHSYSKNGLAGSPESPMLSVGLTSARSDLVSGLLEVPIGMQGDVGGATRWGLNGLTTQLPDMNDPAALRRWAPDVQHALAEFELMSHLAFRSPPGQGAAGAELHHLAFAAGGSGSTPPVTAQAVATMSRPPRPFFEAQLRLVDSWASSRDTRGPEILTQIDPPIGYFASIANLHPERTPKTLRLIALAQHFAYMVGMQFKHALACPRPIEYSALVQPIIDTPAHATLPAGHAVESFMAAGVIEALVPGFTPGSRPSVALRRQAHRIAQNRVVAGLHFPIDCVAGELLGTALAEYFVAQCVPNGGKWAPRAFDGASLLATDGVREHLADVPLDSQAGCSAGGAPSESVPGPNPILNVLWMDAWNEWPLGGNVRPV